MDYIPYIRNLVGHEKVFLCCVGVVIFNERNEILLQRRTDTGTWGLLGGSMNFDEDLVMAVTREVSEEAALEIKAEKLTFQGIYTNYPFVYPNGDQAQIISIIFNYQIDADEHYAVNDDESYEFAFFAEDNLPELFNKQTIDMVADFFNQEQTIFIR